MRQCHGNITNPKKYNFGQRCSMFVDDNEIFCQYHKNLVNNTKVCVDRIKEYLNNIDGIIGKDNIISIVKDMFDFIVHNIGFVNEYPNFKNCVMNKLIEFKQDGWNDADIYRDIISNHDNKN